MGCVICQNPPFIFIHVPKTGGTSLFSTRSLATREISAKCKHFSLMSGHHTAKNLSRKHDFSQYLSFSIVRNPYDRFISLWLNKNGREKMTLDHFINGMISRRFKSPTTLPQSYWLTDGKDLLVSKILKFEQYKDSLDELLIYLGLPTPKLPTLRKTKRMKDYQRYFKSQKQIDFVTSFYKEDLERFNYAY